MPAAGLVTIPAKLSVDEAVAALLRALESAGVQVFAVVDHSGEADKMGLRMPNTKLVIFGNPKAGTPLMLAAPSAAIDLPLKILVAADPAGRTWISYNAPDYLIERHGIPANLAANIAVIEKFARAAAS